MNKIAHRTYYANGTISTCAECGADWYDARDTPPMFKRIWEPGEGNPGGVISDSVWGVTCDECGAQYAQINLYSRLFKND
jgi:hypothetical protein